MTLSEPLFTCFVYIELFTKSSLVSALKFAYVINRYLRFYDIYQYY